MTTKTEIVQTIIDRLGEIYPDATFSKNPFRETPDDELPQIKVALMQGTAEEFDNVITYRHNDRLVIAFVDSSSDDDFSDELYEEEEKIRDFLIETQNTDQLGGLLNGLIYQGYEMSLKTAETSTGAVILTFNVDYFTEHRLQFPDLAGVDYPIRAKGSDKDVLTGEVDLVP